MRKLLGFGLVGALAAGAALAEPVTGKDAAKQLFAPDAVQVTILPEAGLDKTYANALKSVILQQKLPYYGAAALSPDEGLMSEATIFVGNYHDIDHASTEALKQCNAKKTGKTPCVIAATVLPKGWKARGLQLSHDATAGFKKGYPKSGGALATSATTGSWSVGADVKAALDGCAKMAGAKDCAVVTEN